MTAGELTLAAREAGTRYVFAFADGGAGDAPVLGGKGAGLAHMTSLGLPVPPGFVVSCRTGRAYLAEEQLPSAALAEIDAHLARLEATIGRRLGDPQAPLLVSVRSGAPVSMPGMMDTILNVGLNADTVQALARQTANEEFAWACYERLIESYARVVRGVGAGEVDDSLMELGHDVGRPGRVAALLSLIEEHDGTAVPDDPREQIFEAVAAVFRSWDSPRAKAYRRFRGIADDLCTAATVQAMVFGNMGETSGSGVAFTRDPSSGAHEPFGDFLFDAQGEDVVAGERDAESLLVLGERLPVTHRELVDALSLIEEDARDLCEVEFTIEERALWVLQTRVGLRSGRAAVRVAVDLVREGLISIEEAIDRITPAQLEAAAAPSFASEPRPDELIARGLAASPGATWGNVVFDAARAAEFAEAGDDVVLVRPTTSPGDVAGFIAARAVVTGRGGRTSHAAVVARGMHRPAVCGIGEVRISDDRLSAELGGHTLREGDVVSVDGDRGLVMRGAHALGQAVNDPSVRTFLSWCSERRQIRSLSRSEVADLPVVETLTGLEAGDTSVLMELKDPSAVTPPDFARALSTRTGSPPVLLVTPGWLRAADVRLRGRVSGLVAPESSPATALLQATLEPA
jgi:pyruvate, orthophosphate dikinase